MVVRTQNALESLYETDETAWLDKMAELIRDGRFEDLDLFHLEEYLSDMAKRDRKEVTSRLTILLIHLLKWTYQPEGRTGSWHSTILTQRDELAEDVAGGVLRNHAIDVLPKAYSKAVLRAAAETGLPAKTFPTTCPYTLDDAMTIDVFGTS